MRGEASYLDRLVVHKEKRAAFSGVKKHDSSYVGHNVSGQSIVFRPTIGEREFEIVERR